MSTTTMMTKTQLLFLPTVTRQRSLATVKRHLSPSAEDQPRRKSFPHNHVLNLPTKKPVTRSETVREEGTPSPSVTPTDVPYVVSISASREQKSGEPKAPHPITTSGYIPTPLEVGVYECKVELSPIRLSGILLRRSTSQRDVNSPPPCISPMTVDARSPTSPRSPRTPHTPASSKGRFHQSLSVTVSSTNSFPPLSPYSPRDDERWEGEGEGELKFGEE